jgi:hypothetical protein
MTPSIADDSCVDSGLGLVMLASEHYRAQAWLFAMADRAAQLGATELADELERWRDYWGTAPLFSERIFVPGAAVAAMTRLLRRCISRVVLMTDGADGLSLAGGEDLEWGQGLEAEGQSFCSASPDVRWCVHGLDLMHVLSRPQRSSFGGL